MFSDCDDAPPWVPSLVEISAVVFCCSIDKFGTKADSFGLYCGEVSFAPPWIIDIFGNNCSDELFGEKCAFGN